MAYSSSGKKIYASIKDLPQYTSITDGDKIIVWNESRDGAAVVDYGDFIIDLDHTTFKSTINQVITVASDMQAFVNTVAEDIEGIKETVLNLEKTINNELKSRIKTLEYVVAIILGANSYWRSSTGLNTIKDRFLINGIVEGVDDSESDDESDINASKWFNGFISAVDDYISKTAPTVDADDILLQSKFNYSYTDAVTTSTTATSTASYLSTKIETKDGDGNVTSSTTISYE